MGLKTEFGKRTVCDSLPFRTVLFPFSGKKTADAPVHELKCAIARNQGKGGDKELPNTAVEDFKNW